MVVTKQAMNQPDQQVVEVRTAETAAENTRTPAEWTEYFKQQNLDGLTFEEFMEYLKTGAKPGPVEELNLNALAEEIHEANVDKGFWDNGWSNDVFGTKLALVHSEATEALEVIRKQKGEDEFAKEISDILIRTLDLWYATALEMGWKLNLQEVMLAKLAYNRDRPHRHGVQF